MFLATLAIVGRVAQLQIQYCDDFASAFSQTTEVYEDLPARNGRILAADGSLLAGDLERFDVAIFYPALQDPPDETWIKDKARQRLSRSERKNPRKLAAEKQKVIAELDSFWHRLSELVDRPISELNELRQREQNRVERIKRSVHARYARQPDNRDANLAIASSQDASWWPRVWRRIQQEFSEPMDRVEGPRLIAEELEYHTILKGVDSNTRAEIEAHHDEWFPYTRITVQTRRTYPRNELASHLIGVRKGLTDEQLRKRKQDFPEDDWATYRVGDSCGLSGLEKTYESHLKGSRGRRMSVKNRRGEVISSRIALEPRQGQDLLLTLDADLQQSAEQLLDHALTKVTAAGTIDLESNRGTNSTVTCPQGGCLVALDVHTGAIVAAASAPRFDLNLLITPDADQWNDVISDRRSPLFSRVTHMALPPGSVFKVISAVASIESNAIAPELPFHCRGYLDRPDQYRCLPYKHQHVGHHDVTLTDALCRSCNVYFFTAARRMGPHVLFEWARRFGIGLPTGIDLPSESAGRLPDPNAQQTVGKRKSWKPGDTLGMAIGQSSLEVTPLQMVRAMAAIANDGFLVTPHLAAGSGPATLLDSNSANEPRGLEPTPIDGLHPATLDFIREGLIMVVHDPRGTAYSTVRMKEVTIAGKTGTAETNGGVDHAWFAGYVPAEQPRIAFVVVLEHGGGGGKSAGPVAHDFVKKLIEYKHITKTTNMLTDSRPGAR